MTDKKFIKVYAKNWGFVYIDVYSIVAYKFDYRETRIFLPDGSCFFVDGVADATGYDALIEELKKHTAKTEVKNNEISPY